jgi:hypothetical protein
VSIVFSSVFGKECSFPQAFGRGLGAMFLGLHWTTIVQVVWAVSVMSATSIFVFAGAEMIKKALSTVFLFLIGREN